MSLIKRVTATITATADRTVSRFENHEAVSEAALESARRAVAEARAAVRRHDRAGAELTAAREAAGRDAALWARRAREHAADDDVALACLSRRGEADGRARSLARRLEAHAADGTALRDRTATLERRHDALVRRHETLRSRSSLARAERTVDEIEPQEARLDDVLERWETSVDAEELRTRPAAPARAASESLETSLSARLEREERDRALRDELAALRGSLAAGDDADREGLA